MKILVLSAKRDISSSLADALREYGHTVNVAGVHLVVGRFKQLREATRIALKEASQAEVIILDGSFYDIPIALIAHKVKGVPLVLQFHGYFPAEFEEDTRSRLTRGIYWFVRSHLIKSCTHIVFVSQWLRAKYLNTPRLDIIKDKPSSVIHVSADAFFQPADIPQHFQSNTEISLCYAGNFGYLDKTRGVILLLDAYFHALKIFPCLRFYICSDGRHRHLLQEMASRLDLDDNVVFTGMVSKEELRDYYRRSDLFVYSSFLDGCPQTVLEAQACGTPAIVTQGSGAAELVDDGVSGIVCQPTVESLVESIVYMVQNPQIRQAMAVQAVEHVRHNVSWEIAAGKFSEVIANLCHSRKGS